MGQYFPLWVIRLHTDVFQFSYFLTWKTFSYKITSHYSYVIYKLYSSCEKNYMDFQKKQDHFSCSLRVWNNKSQFSFVLTPKSTDAEDDSMLGSGKQLIIIVLSLIRFNGVAEVSNMLTIKLPNAFALRTISWTFSLGAFFKNKFPIPLFANWLSSLINTLHLKIIWHIYYFPQFANKTLSLLQLQWKIIRGNAIFFFC